MAVYDRLPPGEQKLADTTLSRLNDLASYSATELALSAKVSKATAVRFFRRIGYQSFGQVRRQARAEAHLASPLYALAGINPKERATDALSKHVGSDIRNLTETFQRQDARQFERAVSLLAEAPRVRVIGMRNGQFVAQHAAYLLAQLRDDVASMPGASMTLAEDLASLDKRDVLVVVDFRRRAAMLPTIVNAARGLGVNLVFISGPGMSALSRPGDIALQCLTEGAAVFDSYVAAISIVNYLATAVAKQLEKHSRKRLEVIEALHESLEDLRP
ncbi:MAG: MurR/RpiR family transcriptional regulator [Gammaproteobacteria bacterium]|nr:MurR/RpiR family transcriptional regulator [Rhodocyclaceae bacterium]MBU3908627.1 MurR/RpiR family transcriptional regulator [Gammaproteobacteria bacterium]MBU4004655.1 MurR/RpiR family transcriptional regulator [Gammaproteobacteria bacterium]MBU4021258.1 MurR/RpiR family transcriptional regulator [Gammaproteobacteria bacterium]MBU4096275.1 MurR/RpiR family transcriptional regulator [Gammaproteobacteria bacterium]